MRCGTEGGRSGRGLAAPSATVRRTFHERSCDDYNTDRTAHGHVDGTRWDVDRAATSVDFAVKTFWGLMTVRGRFNRFDGSYEVAPVGTRIQLTVEADSLDTGNTTRDKHLRGDDFFHVGEHPRLRFTSTRVRDLGYGKVEIEGDLEAAGKSEPLAFDATVTPTPAGLQIEGDHDCRPTAARDEHRPGRDDPPAGHASRQGAAEERRRWGALP